MEAPIARVRRNASLFPSNATLVSKDQTRKIELRVVDLLDGLIECSTVHARTILCGHTVFAVALSRFGRAEESSDTFPSNCNFATYVLPIFEMTIRKKYKLLI